MQMAAVLTPKTPVLDWCFASPVDSRCAGQCTPNSNQWLHLAQAKAESSIYLLCCRQIIMHAVHA